MTIANVEKKTEYSSFPTLSSLLSACSAVCMAHAGHPKVLLASPSPKLCCSPFNT